MTNPIKDEAQLEAQFEAKIEETISLLVGALRAYARTLPADKASDFLTNIYFTTVFTIGRLVVEDIAREAETTDEKTETSVIQ